MKRNRDEKAFLEALEEVPNVSLACAKVGLSRNTVYRWCKEDPAFKACMEEALTSGVESINDLAENQLAILIKLRKLPAIKFWLENNKKKYMRPRPKDFLEDYWNRNPPITKIEIIPLEWKDVPGSEDLLASSE